MKPVVLVAGLGRCGTTLTMNMLAAGGIPGAGRAPAYEPDEIKGDIDPAWLDAQAGRCVKLLDAHGGQLPPMTAASTPRRVLWLDRDPVEQAKSQAKMAVTLGGFAKPNRAHMRRWIAGLPQDRRRARLALVAAGCPIEREFRFEQLLKDPETVARKLADWLRPDFGDLDEEAMARVVIPRSPVCAPDLSLEVRLIEEAERAAA